MKLKILKFGYQRNGIRGEGFHYFLMSWKDVAGVNHQGIATLTVDCDSSGEHPKQFNGSCRVVTWDNLKDHWRGDVFEDEIRKMWNGWYKSIGGFIRQNY